MDTGDGLQVLRNVIKSLKNVSNTNSIRYPKYFTGPRSSQTVTRRLFAPAFQTAIFRL